MVKPQPQRTPDDIFAEAVEDTQLSSGDLRLLTAGLVALRKTHEVPLNEIEQNAVFGMISYVAFTQNVGEEVVGEVLTSHFGVVSVMALPSRLYQQAIEYLVDLKMDKAIN